MQRGGGGTGARRSTIEARTTQRKKKKDCSTGKVTFLCERHSQGPPEKDREKVHSRFSELGKKRQQKRRAGEKSSGKRKRGHQTINP